MSLCKYRTHIFDRNSFRQSEQLTDHFIDKFISTEVVFSELLVMDQFATRGHFIKGKQCHPNTVRNNKIVFVFKAA